MLKKGILLASLGLISLAMGASCDHHPRAPVGPVNSDNWVLLTKDGELGPYGSNIWFMHDNQHGVGLWVKDGGGIAVLPDGSYRL